MAIIFPAWVLASFLGSNLLVGGILWLVNATGFELSRLGSAVVLQTLIAALVYVFAFVIAFGVPYALQRRKVTLETLGLQRLMSWSDIGLAPLAFIAYLLATAGILALVVALFPAFPADQAQDVGFKNLSYQSGYLLAFITLVVIAPIAEEILFRGYLYGKMRKHVPVWAAILVTSLLFGAVHAQWNVSLDTFVLSILLCSLREVSGSIWAGILLHMLKNMVAFYLLFLSPIVTPGIGG